MKLEWPECVKRNIDNPELRLNCWVAVRPAPESIIVDGALFTGGETVKVSPLLVPPEVATVTV
jgi:hypothetical protein